MSDYAFFATAPKYMGRLLTKELERLGMREISEGEGGVRFRGRLEDGYRVCLWSRIANRVLLALNETRLNGPDEIYDCALAIPWEDHLTPDQTLAVQFAGSLEGVTNRQYAVLRVKDAICDRLVQRMGRRPNVDRQSPNLRIHVYGDQNRLIISLDLSGESLHQRGYRQSGLTAPLKENLAAALLIWAGWPQIAAAGGTLLDPMCGSGTLIIEGALMAADIAPGLLRSTFGFQGWLQHDEVLWQRLLSEARLRRRAGIKRLGTLRGYDVDTNAIRLSQRHLERAGLAGCAQFERRELARCEPGPDDEEGLVIVNPPYGERIESLNCCKSGG